MLLELWLSLSKSILKNKSKVLLTRRVTLPWFLLGATTYPGPDSGKHAKSWGGVSFNFNSIWFLLEAFPKLTYTCISRCLYLLYEWKYMGKTFISLYPEHIFTHLNTVFHWWWFWHPHLLSKFHKILLVHINWGSISDYQGSFITLFMQILMYHSL